MAISDWPGTSSPELPTRPPPTSNLTQGRPGVVFVLLLVLCFGQVLWLAIVYKTVYAHLLQQKIKALQRLLLACLLPFRPTSGYVPFSLAHPLPYYILLKQSREAIAATFLLFPPSLPLSPLCYLAL
ncbi:hypothetical protein AO1008_05388 [Aspergillus oryzae 100-8]|uniref:Uncharacterized protein n=1 Tax=Aspergillus oryzae (strain 3.042) TaxID=1160506 RepID=I8A119_ASPO3|nr:hypothetical protein Ao3042_05510 [Aspergillus oryzae 3.042]KDE79073.1 hypothetical protein AO1008_05388 [Aspergillus oryzae 100-8]|eukprot:EIT78337.1 hypothetical protein Ao3042_05510 [Aspergillus oryzae 3.042]